MNKKLALLICLLAFFGLKISAQENISYGIFLGGSINTMNIDKSFYYDDSEPFQTPLTNNTYNAYYLTVYNASVKPIGGFILGGFFEYKLTERVGLQLEIFYNQYGYKLKGKVDQINHSDTTTYNYNGKLKMSNFSAALLMKYYVLPDKMSIDLGIQPSYCFRAIKETERGIIHKDNVYDSNNEYNPLNLCATGGVTGYFFDNITVSARYTIGFTDVLKVKEPYNVENTGNNVRFRYSNAKSTVSSIQLTVGYRW